jgi:tetratricopeptide (TPR) repeat protein
MLEDGIPPPVPVVIERVCNGASHAEGYTDSRGYFSVQLGQSSEAADASEAPGALGRIMGATGSAAGAGVAAGPEDRLANCELRARLGGYRSQAVSLINRSSLDNPDVGTILLHRLGKTEERTVTASTLKASKPARKALQQGMDLAKKKEFEKAMDSLRKAVELDPGFAFAWCELGKLQLVHGLAEEAHQSFEAGAKAEPRWPDPLLELSLLDLHARNWKELADVSDRVLRLDSFDYPQAFFFNAVANYNLRRLDAAEKGVRAAQRLDTQHQYPQIARLLGDIFADRHDYAAAADEFRDYLALAPRAADAPAVRKQLENMEKLALQASPVARKEE